MSDASVLQQRTGVWFVYDGDCPICSMAAHALKIKQRFGEMNLVNARENLERGILKEIRDRNLDLDEGMVIWCEGQFFHGKRALRFMAQFGDETGWFNRMNRVFFNSDVVTEFSYPWMRALRNVLLKLRGVAKLNNLRRTDEPIFKAIFGNDWERLPNVIQRHYANRAFQDDEVTVEGSLNVVSSPLGRILRPIFRLCRILVPYEGRGVPVTVNFVTDSKSNAFRFHRIFYFPRKLPYEFRSSMIHIRENQVVEVMGPGLGWLMTYVWDGQKVMLKHKGYAFRVFETLIPLPLTFLLGAGYAEEIPISDDEFYMMTEIRHPWWGRVFGYSGTFKVTKDR